MYGQVPQTSNRTNYLISMWSGLNSSLDITLGFNLHPQQISRYKLNYLSPKRFVCGNVIQLKYTLDCISQQLRRVFRDIFSLFLHLKRLI